ncbi:MAG: VWA domain-containing protein [Rhodospirillales bacterium]|nr:MAG: VWA domain-containing protein [Rhodospirillales bacterium]
MDVPINRFICLLKRNGVRISPAESIDAMQALLLATLADRNTVRAVLRSTLIKDAHDIPVFEDLFDLFFAMPRAGNGSTAGGGHGHHHDGDVAEPDRIVFAEDDSGQVNTDAEHAHGEPVSIRDFFDPETMITRFNPHQDPNQLSLSAMSQGLILNRNKGLLDQVMKKVTHQLQVKRVKNIANPGELNFNDGLPFVDEDLIVNAAEALLEDLRELDIDEALIDRLASSIDGIIENLPDLLKRYVEREMALQPDRADAGAQPEPIRSAYDYRFSEAERREMEEIVRRLGRKMKGARSSRRVESHRGRIDVARTMRGSMVFDGIPFRPVMTRRQQDKPRIVVICDVSLSVRTTARFMLHLVYSLQALFEQVRSFVFVSDLADATQYFEDLSIDQAIASVFSGDLIDCDANSNYGKALGIFCQTHLGAVTDRTTVMVLGDGRGNRNPPNVRALEEIRRRARQLVWLSPEPRGSWGLGSSDMPLYEPVCHRAEVVRNLKQLGQVTESLLRAHGTGAGGATHAHAGRW